MHTPSSKPEDFDKILLLISERDDYRDTLGLDMGEGFDCEPVNLRERSEEIAC